MDPVTVFLSGVVKFLLATPLSYWLRNNAWPYWLYFCNLETDTLRMMTMCCMNSLTAIKVDGNPQVQVEYEPYELLKFLARDLLRMNTMCDQGGMFESLIYDRSKAVFEYFGLPYDGSAA